MKRLSILPVIGLFAGALLLAQNHPTGDVVRSRITAYSATGVREVELVAIGNLGSHFLYVVYDPQTGLCWSREYNSVQGADVARSSESFGNYWMFVVEADAITALKRRSGGDLLLNRQSNERHPDSLAAQAAALKRAAQPDGSRASDERISLGPVVGPAFRDGRPWRLMDLELLSVTGISEGWRMDIKSHAVKYDARGHSYQANDTASILFTPTFDLITHPRAVR